MTYGLQFMNNNNVVTLDSEVARMCVVASGTLRDNGSSDKNSTNMFPRAVTTQEPPLIFVRPSNPNNGWAALLSNFAPVGSPGNWTGFNIVSTYVQSRVNFSNGDWFACQFGGQAVAKFGMRLWDGSGNVLFDSDSPAANFTRAAQTFSYVKTTQGPTGEYTNYYSTPFSFDTGEFQMVNQFGMKLIDYGASTAGRRLASWWDWPANTLWATTQSFSNPYDFHIPALFAKILA